MTRHDVVLVLFKERTKDFLHVLSEVVGLDLRRVCKAIHHVSDAAVLETFSNGLPAILHELRRVAGLDTEFHHAVKAED